VTTVHRLTGVYNAPGSFATSAAASLLLGQPGTREPSEGQLVREEVQSRRSAKHLFLPALGRGDRKLERRATPGAWEGASQRVLTGLVETVRLPPTPKASFAQPCHTEHQINHALLLGWIQVCD
jgi:hypothetical protein